MVLQPNKVREKLSRGQCVTGAAVFSWSPYVIDAAALAGLDFLRIDTEHAWRQDSTLEPLIRAALLGSIVPIVRIDRDNPYLARKVLEMGAGGIIVPNVRSTTDAANVVRAARFPPNGDRGYSANCWSAGWGTHGGAKWIEWSNREPLLGIMIEHVDAMDHIDEIMAVAGIDFALFGPADYSMSLGLAAPDAQDPRVQAAIAATARAARQAGKHVSLGVGTNPEEIRKYVELGIDMLELGNDLGIVRAIWSRSRVSVEELTAKGKTAT